MLPYESRAGAVSDAANDLIPILKADARFPPTIFVHGTEDPIVPVEESRLFARVLAGYGIETKVIEVVGAVHGFDNKPGFDGAGLEGVVRFLLKHVAA